MISVRNIIQGLHSPEKYGIIKSVRIHRKGGPVMKYVCSVCGYIYDPEVGEPDSGVAAGTAWEDVPDDFVCPLCGVGKDEFAPEE